MYAIIDEDWRATDRAVHGARRFGATPVRVH
jgi:hypothetical protein